MLRASSLVPCVSVLCLPCYWSLPAPAQAHLQAMPLLWLLRCSAANRRSSVVTFHLMAMPSCGYDGTAQPTGDFPLWRFTSRQSPLVAILAQRS